MIPDMDTAQVKIATSPFDDPQADLILRTSDGIHFRVHKIILSLTSRIFKDMFALPLPNSTEAHNDDMIDGVHVVSVSEDYSTLDLMLRFLYPIPSPAVTLQHIATLLEMSRKYELRLHDFRIEQGLRDSIKCDAVGVFALAKSYELQEISRAALRDIAKMHLHTIDSPLSHFLTFRQYHDIFIWRHKLGLRVCDLLDSPSWYITTLGCSFATKTPCAACYNPDWSTSSQMSSSSNHTGSRWYIHKSFRLYLNDVRDALHQGSGLDCIMTCASQHARTSYCSISSKTSAAPKCNGLPSTAFKPFAEALVSATANLYPSAESP